MRFRITTLVLGLVAILLMACTSPSGVVFTFSDAVPDQPAALPAASLSETFRRIPSDVMMPTGQSVANDCQDPAADYPYQPYDWPDASATLKLQQSDGQSNVKIKVKDTKPNTHYTVWLRLRGEDAEGVTYGGSPLTGIPGTPLIPTSELGEALATIPGTEQEINGFYTDEKGDATFEIDLDFPIINGAYPFQKFEGFEASDERFPIDDPKIHPVAIIGSGGPFTLRVVSHCTDGLGHGLLPGPHEGWFDWNFTP